MFRRIISVKSENTATTNKPTQQLNVQTNTNTNTNNTTQPSTAQHNLPQPQLQPPRNSKNTQKNLIKKAKAEQLRKEREQLIKNRQKKMEEEEIRSKEGYRKFVNEYCKKHPEMQKEKNTEMGQKKLMRKYITSLEIN